MSKPSDVEHRPLDLICLGRAAVDLYSEQVGSRLEDVSSFAKYLGGSSGNIAYGTARLGLKSAMLTRVGDEHMGRFVREELARAGVDVSHVVTDPDRLTGLVILGLKDRDTFPLIFYRHECADMAVSVEDFSPEFIASSRALLITGTHFSTAQTFETSRTAMRYAREAGTRVILDIDYRPVLWGLTGPGEGENRFVSSDSVTAHLQSILPDCDLIVGTEEEMHIAGGSEDTVTALRAIRALTDATLVLKLGAQGCTVLNGPIPDSESSFDVHTGVRVEVLNVLGAGDAFLSGFLRGWLRGESDERSCDYANACGALVVSRHGCAPAIPDARELDDYLSRADSIPRPERDTRLNRLHRIAGRRKKNWSDIYGMAFDHRRQLFDMAREVGADPERIKPLKRLLIRATERGAERGGVSDQVGVLIDDSFGQEALNEVTGRGWWIGRPVELPGSMPLELEGGRSIGSRLKHWPIEHVVKCLVFYHPDQPIETRLSQERQLKELYRACLASGHELLIEVIPPSDRPSNDDTLPLALQRFYNLGIFPDWWKLPAPSRDTWHTLDTLITERDPHCHGVVLLGLDAPIDELKAAFNHSAGFDICRGFTVGRTLFGEPSRDWLAGRIDDDTLVQRVSDNYLELIHCWRNRVAG
ncbi:bifunctional 5-dehydro-2-deoxygluconokinase/5-dehydro-2-deoxyphosphogluconate aldolase [Saccharospirillum salsuginis]|uniref:5-dehydro-2-deoxygluconokinase n=1 Tax=Saccharospirillum salsuginis TaxID=418750 RepID=A0A918KJA5_9GAMM|nr:5-dehydro-2-deoxygluconokinase [Saccharospirillum salsuginis]GGX65100.1 5-dehydro-2-deoxygluconokinase [Saccharospirillum salsuginis]